MTGIELIAHERARQVGSEGWTVEHDDSHVDGTLARAAVAYASAAYAQVWQRAQPSARDAGWPWDEASWKPSNDPFRDLVKAGALIAAEIDRRQRRQSALEAQ